MQIEFIPVTTRDNFNKVLLKDEIYKEIIGLDILAYVWDPHREKAFLVTADNKPMGAIILRIEGPMSVSFHGGIYKDSRGDSAFCKKLFKKLKKFTYPMHMYAPIKPDNKANKLVQKAGWTLQKQIRLNNQTYNYYSE